MKRLTLLIVSVLVLVFSVNARTFVLVTGVSSYENADANLSQTTKDAKSFKRVMETQTKDITLLTSKYANHDNIMEKLRAICNRAQKETASYFSLAGMVMMEAFVRMTGR